MKTLFLDIDGVIAPEQCWSKQRSNKWGCYPFDDLCVQVVNDIVNDTNCEIILSSDWSYHYTLTEIREIFLWNDVVKAPVGFTPYSPNYRGNNLEQGRAEEINQWVDLHRVDQWVAVDDLNLSEHLTNFVHCARPLEGIKQSGIKEKILKFFMTNNTRKVHGHICNGSTLKGKIIKYPQIFCSLCKKGIDVMMTESEVDQYNKELRQRQNKRE